MNLLATKIASRDSHPDLKAVFGSVLPSGHGGECTASRTVHTAGDVGDP
jgi:hypothetical protein